MTKHDTIEASYNYCRQVSRRAGSNFHLGFLLLPREKRRAMEALYAFMRHTDDLADNDRPEQENRDALAAWRAALKQNMVEAVNQKSEIRNHKSSVPVSPLSILPALADAVHRFHIPVKYLFAAIDGVEMDLAPRLYETFDELQPYCERVASAVGMACIYIWGFSGPEAFEPARQMGIAMQLTNILRDLKEDAASGRVYLPLADLRECGYSVDDLRAGVADERFHRLMANQISRAEYFYAGGSRLMNMLDPSGRRIFGLMTDTYHALLRKIADKPADVFRLRVRLTRLEKTKLLARWISMGRGTRDEGWGTRDSLSGPLSPSSLSTIHYPLPTSSLAIIGGGLAGMAAALAAVDRGFRVELFERAKNLGGRASSFVDPQIGERVDFCQHIAMGCCTSFLDFCRRTGVEDCFERSAELHFIGPDARQYDFSPSSFLPAPLHLLPGLFGQKYLSLAERFSIVRALRQLKNAPIHLGEWPGARDAGQTAAVWLRARGQSPRSIELFWSPIIVSALGETVENVSMAAAKKVFCDGFMGLRGSGDLILPRLPLGEIFSDRVAKCLADRGVELNCQTSVRRIECNERRAVALLLADGRRLEFDSFVSAVPWRDVRGLFDERTLAAIPTLADVDRIPPAAITAVHLWFDRQIAKLPHAAMLGRLGQWVFFRPAKDGGQYCQVVISASHRLPARTEEQWIAEILDELKSIWSTVAQARLLHGKVIAQPAAIFSMLAGVDKFRPPQETPIENLSLSGDWTATGWPATMESAIRSGYQAIESLEKVSGTIVGGPNR